MHQLQVLYPPPTDPQAFREYYETKHIPLAAQLPGMRAYRYAFDLGSPGGESPYFCTFQADFDDAAAMQSSMTSEIGARVAADVPNYATGGAILIDFEVLPGT